jgi:hypothetical protein
LWQGTITPRLSSTQQVDFTQSGTSLTGAVRNRPSGQGITFRLTQSADPAIYSGDLVFEGSSGGSGCGAGTSTGSLTVSAGSTMMAGSFTLPAAGSCPAQTYQVQLTKQ